MWVYFDGVCCDLHRTRVKIAEGDLLAWLQHQELFPKLYWKGQIEVAAIGAIASWDHLPEIEDESGELRIFGGTSFTEISYKDSLWNPFPKSYFFLPAYELVREEEGYYLYINAFADQETPPLLSNDHKLSDEKHTYDTREDLPNYPVWEQLLQKALEDPTFDKVVLARRTTLSCAQVVEPLSLLHQIRQKTTAKVVFGFQLNATSAFIGATPERLFIRQGREVFCDVVAGTCVDPEGLFDPKLQREFSYVKEWIKETLSPLCSFLSCASEDALTAGYKIWHLYNRFQGVLNPSITDSMLLKTLHPTPAIGGYPREPSLQFIQENEPFERGWYSAPLGWTSASSSEFAVAIRSALIQDHTLHLFAGLGIVEGSLPHLEWQELELKIAQYLQL